MLNDFDANSRCYRRITADKAFESVNAKDEDTQAFRRKLKDYLEAGNSVRKEEDENVADADRELPISFLARTFQKDARTWIYNHPGIGSPIKIRKLRELLEVYTDDEDDVLKACDEKFDPVYTFIDPPDERRELEPHFELMESDMRFPRAAKKLDGLIVRLDARKGELTKEPIIITKEKKKLLLKLQALTGTGTKFTIRKYKN